MRTRADYEAIYGPEEFSMLLYQLRDGVGAIRVEHLPTGKFRFARGHDGRPLMDELIAELKVEGIKSLPKKVAIKKIRKPRWSKEARASEFPPATSALLEDRGNE